MLENEGAETVPFMKIESSLSLTERRLSGRPEH